MALDINSNQRKALLATVVLSTLILILHFPFDGYVTHYSYTVPPFTECPTGDLKEALRELGAKKFNEIISSCQEKYVITERPLSEWRSNGAAIFWLTSPIHTLVAVLGIIVSGIVFFFAMATPRTRRF